MPPPHIKTVIPPSVIVPTPPPPPSPRFISTVTNEAVPEVEPVLENPAPAPPVTAAPGDPAGNYNLIEPTVGAVGVAEPDKPGVTETFYKVEQMPEFKGDLIKFLQNNVRYPSSAERMGIEGKVYISFIIASDGSIENIKVVRGVYKDLDEEAERVVRKMPKWKAGKQSG